MPLKYQVPGCNNLNVMAELSHEEAQRIIDFFEVFESKFSAEIKDLEKIFAGQILEDSDLWVMSIPEDFYEKIKVAYEGEDVVLFRNADSIDFMFVWLMDPVIVSIKIERPEAFPDTTLKEVYALLTRKKKDYIEEQLSRTPVSQSSVLFPEDLDPEFVKKFRDMEARRQQKLATALTVELMKESIDKDRS